MVGVEAAAAAPLWPPSKPFSLEFELFCFEVGKMDANTPLSAVWAGATEPVELRSRSRRRLRRHKSSKTSSASNWYVSSAHPLFLVVGDLEQRTNVPRVRQAHCQRLYPQVGHATCPSTRRCYCPAAAFQRHRVRRRCWTSTHWRRTTSLAGGQERSRRPTCPYSLQFSDQDYHVMTSGDKTENPTHRHSSIHPAHHHRSTSTAAPCWSRNRSFLLRYRIRSRTSRCCWLPKWSSWCNRQSPFPR